MAALPTPPFIFVDGLSNFRDIGGYPVGGGDGDAPAARVVRPGVVFRASEPSRLTPAGEEALRALGIAHIYDLRSKPEIEKNAEMGVREVPGVARVWTPVFADDDFSPTAMATRVDDFGKGEEGFAKIYGDFFASAADQSQADRGPRPITAILKHLAGAGGVAPPTPLAMHCTAGKDRTGVICAVILALCGVDDDVIAHEYALTGIGLADRMPDMVKYVEAQVPPERRETALAALKISKRGLLASLQKVRDEHGSIEEYLIAHHGLDRNDIERLRRNMIVAVADGYAPVDWRSHAKLLG